MKSHIFLTSTIAFSLLSGAICADETKEKDENHQLIHVKNLVECRRYLDAIAVYKYLIHSDPKNSDYYLQLGNIYRKQHKYSSAIRTFEHAMAVSPDDSDIKSALAYSYLYRGMHSEPMWPHYRTLPYHPYMFYIVPENVLYLFDKRDVYQSQRLFKKILDQKPDNSLSLAGMGRIHSLKGNKYLAEKYYKQAVCNEKDGDTTPYVYLAALLASEKKSFSAKCLYEKVLEMDSTDCQTAKDYNDVLWDTELHSDFVGFYAQENEQDYVSETEKDWTARLYHYGGVLSFGKMLKDRLNFYGSCAYEELRLKNLITHDDIYSLSITRANMGLTWHLNPYTWISGGPGVTYFDQHKSASYSTHAECYFQPELSFSYMKKSHYFFIKTDADAPIVARDFNHNKAKLIDRQFLRLFYEYNFGNRTLIGSSATQVWYINHIKSNKQQIGSCWLQYGPPCLYENIVFKYQAIWADFDHITPSYYTFHDQLTHWVNAVVSKSFFCNQLTTEAGYGYAWQHGYEQAQILTGTPLNTFEFRNRRIQALWGLIEYDPDKDVRFSVKATYSHDNFKYTTASISGKFEWKF